MSDAPAPDELIGKTMAGRFRIEAPLGRGGMGAVYVATDTHAADDDVHRRVALKVVKASLLEDAEAIGRFKREARLLTTVRHDNIVGAIDVGDDGGVMYIAMELLQGESLRDRLKSRGRLMWKETLPIVEQIVLALGAAHDAHVVHRDLKPENVVLVGAAHQTVKLLDFGIAKRSDDGSGGTSTNMTGTGFIVGTPGYVAPEVVLGGLNDDLRSDFYALGVTWFEMLTGQVPFTAKTPFALALRHAQEPAPTPTSVIPFSPIPAPVEALVMRLLAKTAEERPATALELLELLRALHDVGSHAPVESSAPNQETVSFLAPPSGSSSASAASGVIPADLLEGPSALAPPPPPSAPPPSAALVPPPPPPPPSWAPQPSLLKVPAMPSSSSSFEVLSPPTPPKQRRLAVAVGAAAVVAVLSVVAASKLGADHVESSAELRADPNVDVVASLTSEPFASPTAAASTASPDESASEATLKVVTTAKATRLSITPTPRPAPTSPPTAPTLPPPTAPTAPLAPLGDAVAASVTLIVKAVPVEDGWQVSVDDEGLSEGTRPRQVKPGEHRVRFVSRSKGVDVVERVVVGDAPRVVYEGPKAK